MVIGGSNPSPTTIRKESIMLKTKEIYSRITRKWQSIHDIARDDLDYDLVYKVICVEMFQSKLIQLYTSPSCDVKVRLNK